MARPVLILLSWLSLFLTVYGANPRLHERRNNDDIDARDNKVPLRILPLGASLTWGLLSPSGNGYRKPLRDQLRFKGWEVNMVGSKSNATSTMNDKVSLVDLIVCLIFKKKKICPLWFTKGFNHTPF